jgi:uncharacterized RDD family membrane protein YckC
MVVFWRAVQHVGLQHGRALEHFMLLSAGYLRTAIIVSFLLLSFLTNFFPCWFLTLGICIANLFVCFTTVYKRRYQKAIASAVGLYCIQQID